MNRVLNIPVGKYDFLQGNEKSGMTERLIEYA